MKIEWNMKFFSIFSSHQKYDSASNYFIICFAFVQTKLNTLLCIEDINNIYFILIDYIDIIITVVCNLENNNVTKATINL